MSIARKHRRENPPKSLNRRFIVVEGIYQNYGDIAPLKKLIALRDKYKYRIIVDESLSVGVLGKTGRGLTEHFGLSISDVGACAIRCSRTGAERGEQGWGKAQERQRGCRVGSRGERAERGKSGNRPTAILCPAVALPPCTVAAVRARTTRRISIAAAVVDITCASMSNAIASVGGFCVGDKDIVKHQRLSGAGYCYSASLPPYISKASTTALQVLMLM